MIIMRKIRFIFLLFVTSLPFIISAQNTIGVGGGGGLNPLGYTSVWALLGRVMEILIELGIAVAALAIVYAGFQYVMARGSSSEINKATETLKTSVLGLAILLAARIIVETIRDTITNVDPNLAL